MAGGRPPPRPGDRALATAGVAGCAERARTRAMVLTPSGPHFGQGPEQLLVADNLAKSFVQAAIAPLEVIVKLTSK